MYIYIYVYVCIYVCISETQALLGALSDNDAFRAFIWVLIISQFFSITNTNEPTPSQTLLLMNWNASFSCNFVEK